MWAHTGGSWDIPNTDGEPSKSKWLAKVSLEEITHESNSNHCKGRTQWLSPWAAHVSVCTLFPLNKHYTCCTAFHLWEFFLQSRRARALVTDLWSGGQDLVLSPMQPSVSPWLGTQAPLQDSAGQGHLRSVWATRHRLNLLKTGNSFLRDTK